MSGPTWSERVTAVLAVTEGGLGHAIGEFPVMQPNAWIGEYRLACRKALAIRSQPDYKIDWRPCNSCSRVYPNPSGNKLYCSEKCSNREVTRRRNARENERLLRAKRRRENRI